MSSGIYKISNSVTGRSYIGSAVVLSRRISNHRYLLKRKKHPNRYLQASWDKHGSEAFVFSTMFICSKDDLLFFEQRAIDAHDKIYNLTPVAGSQLGFRHSEENRKRFFDFPQLKAGKKVSPATCAAISAGLMGHAVSEKHRKSTSTRLKGKKLSEEHRLKLSLAKLGKKQTPELVAKRALANVGKKRSAEARSRMTAAQRARRATELRT